MRAGAVSEGAHRLGMMNLTVDFDREISALLEYLFGLDRQTDGDFP